MLGPHPDHERPDHGGQHRSPAVRHPPSSPAGIGHPPQVATTARHSLASFERHLRAQNRSERTIGNCESTRLAKSFLKGRGKMLEEATQADLEDFPGDFNNPPLF